MSAAPRPLVVPGAEVHAQPFGSVVPRDWLYFTRMPATATATRHAVSVAASWGAPDLVVTCLRDHLLVEAWTVGESVVVLLHQSPVSKAWESELTEEDNRMTTRMAVAAGLDGAPDRVGVELDADLAKVPLHYLLASCRCSQRWPYHFRAGGLYDLVTSPDRPPLLRIPPPLPCTCPNCER